MSEQEEKRVVIIMEQREQYRTIKVKRSEQISEGPGGGSPFILVPLFSPFLPS